MNKNIEVALAFEVDKLTNSIENALTGELFDTEVTKLSAKDSRKIKQADWLFDWKNELKDATKEVYKLTTANNPTIIQGLLSIEDKQDHIFMNLIESSNFNKGRNKVYLGVSGNLVAYACKVAFERSYQGFVAFDSKTALIKHYQQTLGATHLRGLRMFFETTAATKLVRQYFRN